MDITKALNY